MTFAQLYGAELDRELGSADTTLFTNVRRKAAINAAQLEFCERTECFQREVGVSLVDETQEYNLESSVTDYLRLAKEGVTIWIVSGTTVRYIEGDDLKVTTMERLNVEEPGWRSSPSGTPAYVYTRREAGSIKLGFYPKPDIATDDVWIALVHAVIQPTDMSLDADEPYTYSSDVLSSLKPYHRALVHFAAYDLEKFRKDPSRGSIQLQLFEQYVERYTGSGKLKGGDVVRFAFNYRRKRRGRNWDDSTNSITGSSASSSVSILTLVTTAPVSPSEGEVWIEETSSSPLTIEIKVWRSGVEVVLYTVMP